MAQSPRLLHLNHVLNALVTIDGSSKDAPVFSWSNLRDPTPTRTWRSKLGWNVVNGFNNKIYFTEAGVGRVGTIVTGNYPSGNAYAVAVQTAMNTAPGHTNTYTVTYNPGTFTFTIARATGSNALVLSFGVANQDSCHKDMGYANTTLTGSTSYAAAQASYKSREWLRFRGASANVFNAVLYGTKFAFVSSVFLQVESSDSYENFNPDAVNDTVGPSGPGGLYYRRYVSVQNGAFVRLLIEDTLNTVGYSEIGLVYFGSHVATTRGIVQGWTQQQGQLSRVSVSDSGTIFQDQKPSPRRFSVEFRRLPRSDRDSLVVFADTVRVGGSFFFDFDAQAVSGQQQVFYVTLMSEVRFTQRVGDGTPPDRFDVAGFDMVEHL